MTGLVLTEEQQMLKDTAKRFLQARAPVSELRRLRDERDETGFSRDTWAEMVDMGLAGTLIPESYGGTEFGHVGMGQVFEEAGRNLSASPLFSTAVLGASAINLTGRDEQKQSLLTAIAEGSLITALASDEAARHNPLKVDTQARAQGGGYVVNGRKVFVVDGHVADKLIVSARTGGQPGERDGITLLIVDHQAQGVDIQRTMMMDSRNAAVVTFNNAPAEAVLGTVGEGFDTLQRVLDIGNAQLSAELLGIAQEAFERTVNYLQERKQFGVTIGSFQGLQHRAAHLFSEIELVKSVVLKALQALDAGDAQAPQLVSLAKAKASEVAELATNEGIQMHGGMGMTDEFDIGLFLKRARPVQQLFGDYRYHASRYAALNGY